MTSATERAAWERAWMGLGVAAPPANEYDELMRRYGEEHRAYHTRQHLEECLTWLALVRAQCAHADEIALALWYHDAIYQPRRADNEALSAAWLELVARQAGIATPATERMRELVLATRHDAVPSGADAQILVDIDLSILGARISLGAWSAVSPSTSENPEEFHRPPAHLFGRVFL